MIIALTAVLTLIFSFLGGIHIYWGLGGKWGGAAAIPTKANNEAIMQPKIVECFVVAIGLLGIAVFILMRVQWMPVALPPWLLYNGLWVISGIFTLRAIGEFKYVGFFKKIRSTTFGKMDTRYYSPLCLSIGIMAALLEWLL